MKLITLYSSILLAVLMFQTDRITAQTTNFSLEHTRHDKAIRNPQISPDGSAIIYLINGADWDENKYVNDLWIIDTKTKEQRQLTFDRPYLRNLQWTPDGSGISFIDKGSNDKSQVFLLSMHGGEAQEITDSKTGVVYHSWCPTGGILAYVTNDTTAKK